MSEDNVGQCQNDEPRGDDAFGDNSGADQLRGLPPNVQTEVPEHGPVPYSVWRVFVLFFLGGSVAALTQG